MTDKTNAEVIGQALLDFENLDNEVQHAEDNKE